MTNSKVKMAGFGQSKRSKFKGQAIVDGERRHRGERLVNDSYPYSMEELSS